MPCKQAALFALGFRARLEFYSQKEPSLCQREVGERQKIGFSSRLLRSLPAGGYCPPRYAPAINRRSDSRPCHKDDFHKVLYIIICPCRRCICSLLLHLIWVDSFHLSTAVLDGLFDQCLETIQSFVSAQLSLRNPEMVKCIGEKRGMSRLFQKFTGQFVPQFLSGGLFITSYWSASVCKSPDSFFVSCICNESERSLVCLVLV